MVSALVAMGLVASPAQAASPGGCANKWSIGFNVDSCISGRGATAYPDFYLNNKPASFGSDCALRAELRKPGNVNQRLWSGTCRGTALGHHGQWPTNVAIGPGLCYHTRVVVTNFENSGLIESPNLCF